ncbi:MAG: c-type cytochrome [bacterium]
MKKIGYIPSILVALGVLVIGIAFIQSSKVKNARLPENWAFKLPDGNASAGAALVVKLQCYSCHRMKLASETFTGEMGDIGPDLTVSYSNLPREYLAEAIIKAHSVVADPSYEISHEQAGMGKYNHYLTVEEMLDLVAFLKPPPQLSMK